MPGDAVVPLCLSDVFAHSSGSGRSRRGTGVGPGAAAVATIASAAVAVVIVSVPPTVIYYFIAISPTKAIELRLWTWWEGNPMLGRRQGILLVPPRRGVEAR